MSNKDSELGPSGIGLCGLFLPIRVRIRVKFNLEYSRAGQCSKQLSNRSGLCGLFLPIRVRIRVKFNLEYSRVGQCTK
jgi:hypothetical protein